MDLKESDLIGDDLGSDMYPNDLRESAFKRGFCEVMLCSWRAGLCQSISSV